MGIAENIKFKRLEMGLSQQELADKMGYKTRSTITKIESGENTVSEYKLARFAKVLDTTVDFIKTGVASSGNEAGTGKIKEGNKTIAVVLAGGKSTRNMQNIPNQFINVLGKPVIIYVLEVYQRHPLIDEIYVVCLKDWDGILGAYAEQYGITKLKGILPAGNSGILSVKNGIEKLNNCKDDDVVVLQESTRPLVTEEMISKLLHSVKGNDCTVVVEPMDDHIQFINAEKKEYIERNKIVSLQSPEAYKIGTLREAFEKNRDEHGKMNETTCAMMMYNLGYDIHFCEGNHNNIKVVRQEDIAILSAILRQSML